MATSTQQGTLRLIVWDLARPGKARVERVLAHLLRQRYDLIVLAKCRASTLPAIVDKLEEAGYRVLLGEGSFQPSLVVACLPDAQAVDWPAPKGYGHRWTTLELNTPQPIQVLAVHIPYAGESEGLEGKRRYWEAVLDWAAVHGDKPAMVLGVFNTGLSADTQGERYSLGSSMQDMLDQGWADCWRAANPGINDFGWFSHTGNGFRLDHCFFSPLLAPQLQDAEFDHQARFDGLAASAPLLISLLRIEGRAR